jgi:hypothetical protein
MSVNRPETVTSRNLDLGSVTFQPRNFGQRPQGAASERRISATFQTADQSTVLEHGLNRVPHSFTVVSQNKAGTIYGDIPLHADTRHIVLKSSAVPMVAELVVR